MAALGVVGLTSLTTNQPATAAPAGERSAVAAVATRTDDGPVSVPAPGAGDGATVTVSQTTGLVNQTVEVSWTGFRPSSASRLQNAGDSLDTNTEDPVRVYECRGADPASSSDCYGSPGFRGVPAGTGQAAVDPVPGFTYPGQTDPYASTPDGPANWQDNVTSADGTGQVAIQVFTKRESAGLGCDADAPCSIVVVPNYGRGDQGQGDTEDVMDAPWAWDRRTVVPLSFLPVEDACPLTGSSLSVEGSPMAATALASWRAATCTLATHPVRVDYTAIGEPQTRGDVAAGTTSTGLVIDPLDADAASNAGVVYAPVATTGLVVAFQVDDAEGRPVDHMNLDPRLVAKLITASYRSGGDPAVLQNKPVNIFHDPEFLQLNPGVDWPSGAPGNHVLLLGDLSDTTSALTRWIEADKDARAFLAGKPDPWGMTVNANYKNLALPFASFPLLDQQLSTTFAPVQELDALSRQLSIAQFPGGLVQNDGGVNVTVKQPRQNPGSREVIGIIDAASAARFRLATASLENADGKYVAPTATSMTAAIAHATVGADGATRHVDLTDKTPGAYPLTLQISAALSTTAPAAERTEMADLLSYVAGPGQQPGDRVGQLPPGHAPLTAAQLRDLRTARAAVVAGAQTDPGDGTDPGAGDPGHQPTPDPSGAPTDAPSGDGPSGPLGQGPAPQTTTPTGTSPVGTAPGDGGDPTAPSGGTTPTTSDATGFVTLSGIPAGTRSLLLPGLGLVALLSLLGGPALLWLSRSGRGPQWLRR